MQIQQSFGYAEQNDTIANMPSEGQNASNNLLSKSFMVLVASPHWSFDYGCALAITSPQSRSL